MRREIEIEASLEWQEASTYTPYSRVHSDVVAQVRSTLTLDGWPPNYDQR